jgi:starch synthase
VRVKILIAASEVAPFAKTGGLADVAGALPKALAALGHDVRVVMPRHRPVDVERFHLLPMMKELDVYMGNRRFRGQVLRSTFPDTDLPVYFIQNDSLFDRDDLYGTDGTDYPDNAIRFAFLSLATIWMLKGLDWSPDVIQANDWQTAFIPTYLKNWPILYSDPFYNSIRVLYTIHNLSYQGLSDPAVLPEIGIDWSLFTAEGLEFFDQVNLMKAGIVYADHISTVSKQYAKEIQSEEFGCGLHGVLQSRAASLTGILNGIDTSVWHPGADPLIVANYSAVELTGKATCKAWLQERCGLDERPEAPLIGMISRLVDQKGFDLVAEIIEPLLALDVQLVILGTGMPKYHDLFTALAAKHPRSFSLHLAFDERLAHEIEAGADIFLMPSRFEPCGLNQLYSLRYGTIPVVRRVGGLADSIVPATPETLSKGRATGFAFTRYSADELLKTVRRAVDHFRGDPPGWIRLIQAAMAQDFSWEASAKAYEALFKKMLKRERAAAEK